jgi:hypothetical protein
MSTISSKHGKQQGLVDPVYVLTLLVLILTFAVFTPFNSNVSNAFGNAFGSFGNTSTVLSGSNTVSFAYDQAYWDASCSHGWAGNAACDAIVQRSLSCAISVDSAYCAAYETYLQKFTK